MNTTIASDASRQASPKPIFTAVQNFVNNLRPNWNHHAERAYERIDIIRVTKFGILRKISKTCITLNNYIKSRRKRATTERNFHRKYSTIFCSYFITEKIQKILWFMKITWKSVYITVPLFITLDTVIKLKYEWKRKIFVSLDWVKYNGTPYLRL